MRKNLFTIALSILLIFCFVSPVNSMSNQHPKIKGLMFDLGYGGSGLSAAIGYRWWYFSGSLGLAGFANDLPSYAKYPPTGVVLSANQPLPSGYEEDRYTSIDVFGDVGLHYDFYPYSAFVQIGFYNAQDSILAKNIESGSKYRYKVENSAGISWGLGLEYIFTKSITVGAGYHTRRGGFARLTYTWM